MEEEIARSLARDWTPVEPMSLVCGWPSGQRGAAVVRRVVVNSLALGVAGVAVGVPAALTVTNLLRARLFGIGPSDPMALGLAGAIMLITTIFSAVLPALRAARVDPVRTLRAD
jgi:putative ABC transport system permease protein